MFIVVLDNLVYSSSLPAVFTYMYDWLGWLNGVDFRVTTPGWKSVEVTTPLSSESQLLWNFHDCHRLIVCIGVISKVLIKDCKFVTQLVLSIFFSKHAEVFLQSTTMILWHCQLCTSAIEKPVMYISLIQAYFSNTHWYCGFTTEVLWEPQHIGL